MLNNTNIQQNKNQQCAMIFKSDILLLQKCSASEALVFMVYALHADKNRVSFPSSKTIMEITNLSRGSVMRAIKRLKENKILNAIGQTPGGVVKYQLAGIKSDTCINSDTPPCLESDTTPRPKSDTPHVSELIPITANRKANNINCLKLASTKDEKIFSLLWQKWNSEALCNWQSLEPLKEYRMMRDRISALWKSKNINKDLIYELQVIDLYLMEAKQDITGGSDWNAAPRLWAERKWLSGIEKWLSSPTPSRVSDKRRQYIPNVISLKEPEEASQNQPEQPTSSSADEKDIQIYIQQLNAMYDDIENNNRSYAEVFIAHHQMTPFPKHLKDNQHFYEYFYTVEQALGGHHG